MHVPIVFPVRTPYTISADISKYKGEVYNKHPDSAYLEQKRTELNRFEADLFASGSGANEILPALTGYLQQPVKDIKTLALSMEEDIAVLHKGVLKTICFCFPSGFIPSQKIGLNFFDMHFPVADAEKLLSASKKVSALISEEGNMFRRHVWTVTALPGLSQHPALHRPDPQKIDDLYFRTETQTTVGLKNDICLFLVKVDMYPLSSVWENKDRREALLASINSMGDATLSYKNLHGIKQLLNNSKN